MPDYTMAQIRAMQEDAARRVREMNRRSKSTVEYISSQQKAKTNNANSAEKNEPKVDESRCDDPLKDKAKQDIPAKISTKQPSQQTPPPPSQQHKNLLSFLKSIDLKQLISGGEQSMLLLIIMILMSDNSSDDYLIYALIYIML